MEREKLLPLIGQRDVLLDNNMVKEVIDVGEVYVFYLIDGELGRKKINEVRKASYEERIHRTIEIDG
jgi:hypothetical protein